MEHTTRTGPCALTCWVLGLLAAGIAVVALKGNANFLVVLIAAIVAGVATTWILCRLFCKCGQAETTAAPAPAPAPASKPDPKPEPKADPAAASTPDYDGDGVQEGTGEGSKPATLNAARGGRADNLKEIKGVGPKMEKMLNGMGFYHFDQIAAWSADEVAWVNANLEGFKGRVTRDNWVEQAKILAAGGETEFSKRARDGDVY